MNTNPISQNKNNSKRSSSNNQSNTQNIKFNTKRPLKSNINIHVNSIDKSNKKQISNNLFTSILDKVVSKQNEATQHFINQVDRIKQQKSMRVSSKLKIIKNQSNESSNSKVQKSNSHYETKIINSTINPTKVRTISEKKQLQIHYPKPKVKPKIVPPQPKITQEEQLVKQKKLKQALKRKYQLMQKLRKIDSQLIGTKKSQKLHLLQMGLSQNSSKNVTIFNAGNSRLNNFTNQFHLNLNSDLKNIRPMLNSANSPIKVKQDITYCVPNHNKAVQMLQKINLQKLKRQEKLMNDMKKKQQQQIKKMKQIQQEKQFEYQQKEKRRTERIQNYMKKSMINPLKNLSQKNSQLFQKKQQFKAINRNNSKKVHSKAKFNKQDLRKNEKQIYQKEFVYNKKQINMQNSGYMDEDELVKREQQKQQVNDQNQHLMYQGQKKDAFYLKQKIKDENENENDNSQDIKDKDYDKKQKSQNENKRQLDIIQPKTKINNKQTQQLAKANNTLPTTLMDNNQKDDKQNVRIKSIADQHHQQSEQIYQEQFNQQ